MSVFVCSDRLFKQPPMEASKERSEVDMEPGEILEVEEEEKREKGEEERGEKEEKKSASEVRSVESF